MLRASYVGRRCLIVEEVLCLPGMEVVERIEA